MLLLTAALFALPAPDCSYDRSTMLAPDQRTFDQDMTGGRRAPAPRWPCCPNRPN